MRRTREIPVKTDRIRAGGFTLVEMVVVIALLGIIGLVPSYVMVESMRVYARIAPKVDAAYQARLATSRMKSEIRDLKAQSTITAMTPTAFAFDDSSGNAIAYTLASGDLLRNGDLLAQGVTSLTFSYWRSDGTIATIAAALHLVEIDLTVQTGSEPYRVQEVVFPRRLGSTAVSTGPLNVAASVATVAKVGGKTLTLDLVSQSANILVLESFALSVNRAMPNLKRFKLANREIWKGNQALPTGLLALNKGSTGDRTIPVGGSPQARFEFQSNPSGGVADYTLAVHFTDGASSTLTFSMSW